MSLFAGGNLNSLGESQLAQGLTSVLDIQKHLSITTNLVGSLVQDFIWLTSIGLYFVFLTSWMDSPWSNMNVCKWEFHSVQFKGQFIQPAESSGKAFSEHPYFWLHIGVHIIFIKGWWWNIYKIQYQADGKAELLFLTSQFAGWRDIPVYLLYYLG